MQHRSYVVALFAIPLLVGACNKPKAETTPELPPNAVPVTTAPAAPATTTTTTSASPSPDVKMGPLSFAPVAKKADASVVTIYTVGEERSEGVFAKKRSRTA